MCPVKVIFLSLVLAMSCVIPRAGDCPYQKVFGMHAIRRGEKAPNWRKQIRIIVRKVSQSTCSPVCPKVSYLCIVSYHYISSVLYSYSLVIFCHGKKFLGEEGKVGSFRKELQGWILTIWECVQLHSHCIPEPTRVMIYSNNYLHLLLILTYSFHASFRVDIR